MKEYFIGLATSTNSWLAVASIIGFIFLPKSVYLTLLIVLFFVPDGLVNKLIMKYAPGIQKYLKELSA